MQQGDCVLVSQTDNAYLNTQNVLGLVDPGLGRRIRITKENSLTTVVWNPWQEGAKQLSDLGDDEWQQMVCAEANNILGFAVNLGPGQQHAMRSEHPDGRALRPFRLLPEEIGLRGRVDGFYSL